MYNVQFTMHNVYFLSKCLSSVFFESYEISPPCPSNYTLYIMNYTLFYSVEFRDACVIVI